MTTVTVQMKEGSFTITSDLFGLFFLTLVPSLMFEGELFLSRR